MDIRESETIRNVIPAGDNVDQLDEQFSSDYWKNYLYTFNKHYIHTYEPQYYYRKKKKMCEKLITLLLYKLSLSSSNRLDSKNYNSISKNNAAWEPLCHSSQN